VGVEAAKPDTVMTPASPSTVLRGRLRNRGLLHGYAWASAPFPEN
jgi:hypothetical protein